MDVVNVEQARIAEEAGAVAVMALERVPSEIRRDGGAARMTDPEIIESIKAAVSIPVMAKVRPAISPKPRFGGNRHRLHRRVGGAASQPIYSSR